MPYFNDICVRFLTLPSHSYPVSEEEGALHINKLMV